MSYIGKTPTPAPLTSSDITDGIISTDKLADTSVTNAKINADIISAETELATAPADTDELLISDAGVLKRIDASLIGGGGITEADQYRLTSTFQDNANPISSNWERVDTDGFGKLGTGVTQSSGIFSFASTGVYLILLGVVGETNGDPFTVNLQTTTDNSSYNEACVLNFGDAGNYPVQGFTNFIFDVTSTSTHKVNVKSNAMAGNSNTRIFGSTDANYTHISFVRLGDT